MFKLWPLYDSILFLFFYFFFLFYEFFGFGSPSVDENLRGKVSFKSQPLISNQQLRLYLHR